MDDWGPYPDTTGLSDGDRVIVAGRIDKGFFEATTIEAGSVYVEDLNAFFHANPIDEESAFNWMVPDATNPGDAPLRGVVDRTSPDEGTFTIATGFSDVVVSVEDLGYDPLDDYGYQQIDAGDLVAASGTWTVGFPYDRTFEAETVMTLVDNRPRDPFDG